MVRMQMVVAVVALAVCGSNAEARGGRMGRQPAYNQYYYNTTTPTYTVAPQYTVVQPAAVPQAQTTQTQANGVVQTSGTVTTGTVAQAGGAVQASVATPAVGTSASTPASTPSVAKPAAYGSAQWKAEQSARMGSVQHIGGGFGGGSFEGNGFGATPDQAIQNSCFWGQRTPIEIGVARGANGYYATIFYR